MSKEFDHKAYNIRKIRDELENIKREIEYALGKLSKLEELIAKEKTEKPK